MRLIFGFLTLFCVSVMMGKSYAEAPMNWLVVEGGTKTLSFTTMQMGASFTGQFNDFEADVAFDPERLDMSRVRVSVQMASADTGDAERDETLQNDEWFNVAAHPLAVFETISIQRNTADNAETYPYVANGMLTIADVAQDITLPFSFEINQSDSPHIAFAKGETTLNRMDFGLGAANWADADSIGHNVLVSFELNLVHSVE